MVPAWTLPQGVRHRGFPPPARLLVCNGKILRIEANLYDFLVHLRRQRRGLPLWIDAICINQDKEASEEKDDQIYNKMHLIFGSAARVLVWLGESTNLSKNLPDVMKEIEIPHVGSQYYEGFREENHILRRNNPKLSFAEVAIKALGLEGSLWRMIRNVYRRAAPISDISKLANRDYFQRAWVVQELILAQDLRFFAGSLELSWETILKGYHILAAFRTQPNMGLSDLRSPGFLVLPHIMKAKEDRRQQEVGEGYSWSLDDFLFLLRDRVATEPQDKILSVCGLLDQKTRDEVTAGVRWDEEMQLDMLYCQCAEAIARERGWRYILSLVSLDSATCTDLPSWVPDFRKSLRPKPFWYFGCSSGIDNIDSSSDLSIPDALGSSCDIGSRSSVDNSSNIDTSSSGIDNIDSSSGLSIPDALSSSCDIGSRSSVDNSSNIDTSSSTHRLLPFRLRSYRRQAKLLAPSLWPKRLRLRFRSGIGKNLPGGFSVPEVVPDDLWAEPDADGRTNNKSSRGVLTLPLATFDVIVQVGESHSELNELMSHRMQGHIFDLLTQLGRRYRPTGELTLDALFRTLTADALARDRSLSMNHLRMEFYIWLGVTFDLIETPKIPGVDWLYDRVAEKYGIDTRRDTPTINGRDVDLKTCIDRSAEVHDSAVYHVATIFNREESDREWIREQPSDRELDQLNESSKIREPMWEGRFTVAKLLDGFVRLNNAVMKDVKDAIEQVYKDRRVFRTREGYLGSGPKDVRLGDVVCMVAGSSAPFVFRRVEREGGGEGLAVNRVSSVPSAQELGKVRAVGEAYVHGVMDGELAERLRGSFVGVEVV